MSCRIICILIFSAFIFSCGQSGKRKIKVDDYIVEGDISEDSVYNGMIKFYDSKGVLVQEALYTNDTLKGHLADYYPSGKIKFTCNYDDGEISGDMVFYDSTGKIKWKQYRYHGLWVGPSLDYDSGKLSRYRFQSFNEDLLMEISYKKIGDKPLEALNDTNFFFWHINTFNSTFKPDVDKQELFIFLPDPPGFDFKYSLCIVNKKYEVSEVIKEWSKDKYWDTVELPILDSGKLHAIRLIANNRLDGEEEAIMFKVVD